MTDERYKKIMGDLGFPNMTSLLLALQQVAHEAGTEAMLQERKACALICDELHDQWEREGCNPSEAADAIRARGKS